MGVIMIHRMCVCVMLRCRLWRGVCARVQRQKARTEVGERRREMDPADRQRDKERWREIERQRERAKEGETERGTNPGEKDPEREGQGEALPQMGPASP